MALSQNPQFFLINRNDKIKVLSKIKISYYLIVSSIILTILIPTFLLQIFNMTKMDIAVSISLYIMITWMFFGLKTFLNVRDIIDNIQIIEEGSEENLPKYPLEISFLTELEALLRILLKAFCLEKFFQMSSYTQKNLQKR